MTDCVVAYFPTELNVQWNINEYEIKAWTSRKPRRGIQSARVTPSTIYGRPFIFFVYHILHLCVTYMIYYIMVICSLWCRPNIPGRLSANRADLGSIITVAVVSKAINLIIKVWSWFAIVSSLSSLTLCARRNRPPTSPNNSINQKRTYPIWNINVALHDSCLP